MLIRPKLIPTEQLEKAIQEDMDKREHVYADVPYRKRKKLYSDIVAQTPEAQAAWRKENPGQSDPAIWADQAKDSVKKPKSTEQKMQKALETQRLDNTAVQLEKIFGFRDRKKKEPELGDAGVTPSWSKKWRAADEDKKRVTRQRAQVKEGVGRAAGAVGGAAYEATGAAERGTKRAGSALARAFGAGRKKVQDVAGAPGRRQERKASERHSSNLRQQATDRRVATSDARRDARQQRPTSPEAGRTGYSNGGDTGLGGSQRSAAIPKSRSTSKVQQSDVNRGAAAAKEQAASYQTPGARARAAAPLNVTPAPGGTRAPAKGWQGATPATPSGGAPATPKQQPAKVDPTKPVWGGQKMEKALISLQKISNGDTLMQNRSKEQQASGEAKETQRTRRGEEIYRAGGSIQGDKEYGPAAEAEKRGGGKTRARRSERFARQESDTHMGTPRARLERYATDVVGG